MEPDPNSASLPRTPQQAWLARGGLLLVLVLFVVLQTVGLGEVTVQTVGNTTIYKSDSRFIYFILPFALSIFIMGIVFWMQRGIFRVFSVVPFLMVLAILFFTLVLDTDNHHVSVSPIKIVREVGFSQDPIRHELDLTDVAGLYIEEVPGEKKTDFELVAILKSDSSVVQIPIHDMMKKALPQILSQADQLGIPIAESSNGTPVPDGLLD